MRVHEFNGLDDVLLIEKQQFSPAGKDLMHDLQGPFLFGKEVDRIRGGDDAHLGKTGYQILHPGTGISRPIYFFCGDAGFSSGGVSVPATNGYCRMLLI